MKCFLSAEAGFCRFFCGQTTTLRKIEKISNSCLTPARSCGIIFNVAGASTTDGPVVQLVRTLACHARGRRFEPVPGRHFFEKTNNIFGSIAQLVEQGTENPRVSGSIPLRATNEKPLYQ